jgi:hypothetical protein
MNLVTKPKDHQVLHRLLRIAFAAGCGCLVFSTLLAFFWPGLEEITNLYVFSAAPKADTEDIVWLSVALATIATAYVCVCSLVCLESHLRKSLKALDECGLTFWLALVTILLPISFGLLAGVAHLGEGGLADALAVGFVRFSIAIIPAILLGVPIGLYEEHKEKGRA